MRIHIVTPKAPVHVTLNPRVQPGPPPCPTFMPTNDEPVKLTQSAYWILRLPYPLHFLKNNLIFHLLNDNFIIFFYYLWFAIQFRLILFTSDSSKLVNTYSSFLILIFIIIFKVSSTRVIIQINIYLMFTSIRRNLLIIYIKLF